MTNVLSGLSRLALGRPSLTPRILERLYDEQAGLFHQVVRKRGREARAPERVVTWAALSPLALPDLPEDVGRRLVEEHLLNPKRFWLPFPPPSVSAEDPLFSRSDRFLGSLRRYWRGPTWMNAAWLLWLGLDRLGYDEAAAEMGRRLGAAVSAAGLREYYDPYTGEGMGAQDFSWSALILEMS
jgi:glycogen debranching enzyme